MERMTTLVDAAGTRYDVPESERAAFDAEAQKTGLQAQSLHTFQDVGGGQAFDVPESDLGAFQEQAAAEGRQVERVRPVRMTDGTVADVPDGQRDAFIAAYRTDPKQAADREAARARAEAAAPGAGSAIVAGVKELGRATLKNLTRPGGPDVSGIEPGTIEAGVASTGLRMVKGLAATDLVATPIGRAFDWYAEQLGLAGKDKSTAFGRWTQGLQEVSDEMGLNAQELAGNDNLAKRLIGGAAEGVGGLAGTAPVFAAMVPKLGMATLPAIGAVTASNTGDWKEMLKGAIKGLAQAGILHGVASAPVAARVPAAGTAAATATLAGGGTGEEALSDALMIGGFAAAGRPGDWRETRSNATEAIRGITDSQWYRKATIAERGLVQQTVQQQVAGLQAQGMSEGQIIRQMKRTYGTDNQAWVDAWLARGGGSAEVGGRKSEVGSQRSEVGGPRSEIRDPRSEVRGPRSEIRGMEAAPGPTEFAARLRAEYPARPVKTAEIVINTPGMEQFKEDANPITGEVAGQELRGKPLSLAENPIVVMEMKDGSQAIVTGRHRLALYKRHNRDTIPAHVIREADGWTKDEARVLDGYLNILDEKGTIHDYVRYFDETKPDAATAAAQGLTDRAKGRIAFGLSVDASPDLRAAIRYDERFRIRRGENTEVQTVTPEQAAAIAAAAPMGQDPRNEAIQRVAMREAFKGATPGELTDLTRTVRRNLANTQAGEGTQGDFFSAFGDSFMEDSKKEAQTITNIRNNLLELRRVLSNAITRGDKLELTQTQAQALGIANARDKVALGAALDGVKAQIAQWSTPILPPELIRQARMQAGLPVAEAEVGSQMSDLRSPISEVSAQAPATDPVDAHARDVLEMETLTPEQEASQRATVAEQQRQAGEREAVAAGAAAPIVGGLGDMTPIMPGMEGVAQSDVPLFTQAVGVDAAGAQGYPERSALAYDENGQTRPLYVEENKSGLDTGNPDPTVLPIDGAYPLRDNTFGVNNESEAQIRETVQTELGLFPTESVPNGVAANRPAVESVKRQPAFGNGNQVTSAPYSLDNPPRGARQQQYVRTMADDAASQALQSRDKPELWRQAFRWNGNRVSVVNLAKVPAKPPTYIGHPDADAIRSPRDAARLIWNLRNPDVPSIKVTSLDAQKRPIATNIVIVDVKSAGQRRSGIMFSIRELYGPALRNGAKSIIVTVNHPGGDATPTDAEKRMFKHLSVAGEQLGVPTLDMITTNGSYTSIRGNITEEGFGPAEWEVLPHEQAMRVTDTETATQLMKTLRIAGGNEFAYLVTIDQISESTDTGRRVGAIERVPYDPGTPTVFMQRLAQFAARNAGVNMIVSLPESIDVRALENNNMLIGRVRNWVNQMTSTMGIYLMDVIVPDAHGNLISARTDVRTAAAWAAEVNESAAATAREAGGTQGYAQTDNFGGGELGKPATAVPVADDPRYSAFTFELPELVELARMLMGGAYPKVREQLHLLGGRALGVFRPHGGENGSVGIDLLASTFNLVPPAERAQMMADAAQWTENNAGPGDDRVKMTEERYKSELERETRDRMKRNPMQAVKTLAHEIGHLVDYLPQKMLERGNILGHIAALKGYLKHALPGFPGGPEAVTQKEKAQLVLDARRIALQDEGPVRRIIEELVTEEPEFARLGVTVEDVKSLLGTDARTATPDLYAWFAGLERDAKKNVLRQAMRGVLDADAEQFGKQVQTGVKRVVTQVSRVVGATKEQVRWRFRVLLADQVRLRQVIELDQVKTELGGVIAWWRGTGETADRMESYFKPATEMYAEAFGIFLANPTALAKRAPTAFQGFMRYMQSRPEVNAAYEQLQNEIKSGAVEGERVGRLRESFGVGKEKLMRQAGRTRSQFTWKERKAAAVAAFDRRMGPVYLLIREIDPEMKLAKSGDLHQAVKNFLHQGTRAQLMLQDINAQVLAPMVDTGLDWIDLAEYLFHQRVLHDRRDLANTQGWNPKVSRERLDAMKTQYGADAYAKMEEASGKFRTIYEMQVLNLIGKEGMFDAELMKLLRENVHYATFAVTENATDLARKLGVDPASSRAEAERTQLSAALDRRFGEGVRSQIFRQIGTLQEIRNPATATVSKALSLISMVYRNRLARDTAEYLLEMNDPQTQVAEFRFNGRFRVPVMRDDPRIGTLVWLQDGETRAVYAPRAVVDSLKSGSLQPELAAAWRSLRAVNNVFKGLMTRFHYGFWARNYRRDRRSWLFHMPGAEGSAIAALWPAPARWLPASVFRDKNTFEHYEKDAWKSAASMVDGTPDATARKFLERMMGISRAEFLGDISEDTDIERMMLQHNIMPASLRIEDMKGLRKLREALNHVSSWYMGRGEQRELTVKILGMMFLDTQHSTMPEWKKQQLVTEMSGSPDFLESGRLNPLIDFGVASFFNARKEGLRSEIKAIRAGPSEWAWKRAVHTVAPAMIRWGLASGAFLSLAAAIARSRKDDDGKETDTEAGLREYKEMYDSIPDYYKMVYACYPVKWIDRAAGKVLFITLPLEDNEQKLHTALWAAMDEAGQKTGLGPTADGSMKAIQSNLASDLPMIGRGGPLINMVRPFFEFYMLGQNPQDSFRGTSLLSDDQFKAGGTYAATPLLENAWNASGVGGLIHRIEPGQIGVDNRSVVEKILKYPGISESIGKWVRVSNRGVAEQIRQEEAPQLRADAQTRLDVQRAMTEAKGDATAMPDWAVQRFLHDQYFAEYWTSLARRTAERDMLTPEERAIIRPTNKRTQIQALERHER